VLHIQSLCPYVGSTFLQEEQTTVPLCPRDTYTIGLRYDLAAPSLGRLVSDAVLRIRPISRSMAVKPKCTLSVVQGALNLLAV